MDIGKLKNNSDFYDGYEGEGEIILSLAKSPEIIIHIWDGYFEDIFGNPYTTENEWQGFTRDYQEACNTFSGSENSVSIDPTCYLNDLCLYKEHSFSYEETSSCLDLLIAFFEYAAMHHSEVIVLVS
ncbi:MAG: hypothetical protein Q4D21_09780 [Phascolarctobacterium sp.]|nr:hypothetical protein [Phascolarctobacterium sp.]